MLGISGAGFGYLFRAWALQKRLRLRWLLSCTNSPIIPQNMARCPIPRACWTRPTKHQTMRPLLPRQSAVAHLLKRLAPYGFRKGNGQRRGFSANTLRQLINGIYRAAGIAGATSHSGRRGFITTLANHSVGIKTIMELAGHRQLSTTQRYISVTPDQKRKAVELVA